MPGNFNRPGERDAKRMSAASDKQPDSTTPEIPDSNRRIAKRWASGPVATCGETSYMRLVSERSRAAGFEAGRDLGRQRVDGIWVDRLPPSQLPIGCKYLWIQGYEQGLLERARRGGPTPFRAGCAGLANGFWRSDNPYPRGTEPYEAWLRGWQEAHRAASLAKRAIKLAGSLRQARS